MGKSFLEGMPRNNKGDKYVRLRIHTSYSSSMASAELRPNLLEWTESEVHSWLSSIGFPQYETQIRGGRPPTLLFSIPLTVPSLIRE